MRLPSLCPNFVSSFFEPNTKPIPLAHRITAIAVCGIIGATVGAGAVIAASGFTLTPLAALGAAVLAVINIALGVFKTRYVKSTQQPQPVIAAKPPEKTYDKEQTLSALGLLLGTRAFDIRNLICSEEGPFRVSADKDRIPLIIESVINGRFHEFRNLNSTGLELACALKKLFRESDLFPEELSIQNQLSTEWFDLLKSDFKSPVEEYLELCKSVLDHHTVTRFESAEALAVVIAPTIFPKIFDANAYPPGTNFPEMSANIDTATQLIADAIKLPS